MAGEKPPSGSLRIWRRPPNVYDVLARDGCCPGIEDAMADPPDIVVHLHIILSYCKAHISCVYFSIS